MALSEEEIVTELKETGIKKKRPAEEIEQVVDTALILFRLFQTREGIVPPPSVKARFLTEAANKAEKR